MDPKKSEQAAETKPVPAAQPPQTQPAQAPPKPADAEAGKGDSGWKKILAIAVLILAITAAGLAIYLVMSGKEISELFGQSASTQTEQESAEGGGEEADEAEPAGDGDADESEGGGGGEEDVLTWTDFEGDYVTAEVPESWTITEYADGEGSTMLADGTFEGLTGLSISNTEDEVIFKLEGAYGIGGLPTCEELGVFSDTDEDYVTETVETSEGLGVETETLDFSEVSYAEYNFFEHRVRRVGAVLYRDSTESEDTFDSACGISGNVWELTNFSFEEESAIEPSNSYQVTVPGTPSDADLEVLDDILESMETQ